MQKQLNNQLKKMRMNMENLMKIKYEEEQRLQLLLLDNYSEQHLLRRIPALRSHEAARS